MNLRAWNFLLLLLSCAVRVCADEVDALVLEHLTAADGLPQSSVYATLQDSTGFIWLATEDGLVRFDGHELRRYAYSRGAPRGLPGNFIRDFAEDPHHDIWIALKDAGLARYDRASDDFQVFRHDANNPGSLASDTLRAVAVDVRGRIWAGTSDVGVDVLDPRTGRIDHLRHDPADAASLSDNAVFDLLPALDGTVWVATARGLDHYRPERHGFEHFQHDPANSASLSSDHITTLAQDRSGSLWVGTLDAGVNRMYPQGGVFQRFRHSNDPRSLASDDVLAILEDRAGHIWVGTPDGLDRVDALRETVTHYTHDERDAASLRDSYVLSLYQDRSGLMWIGTRDGGVSRWNPRSSELGGHRPSWLAGKPVTAFAETRDGRLWIASMGGGLKRFDPESGVVDEFDATVGHGNALGDERVMALLGDRRGGLWIGTMFGGLKHLWPDGRLDSYAEHADDPHGLSAKGIMTLYESSGGDIWVGTYGGGVNHIDPQSGLVRQLSAQPGQPGATSSANITSIAEDVGGQLWFGTDGGGLDQATADGRVFAVFRNDPADMNSLPSNTLYSLCVDLQGTLWIGTDKGGLVRARASVAVPHALRFQTRSRDQGLSSDSIYAVLDDQAGHLWMSGNSGLMRYSPTSGAIKTYHREHGAQGEEFDLGAALRLRDGRLAFGGPNGFNLFDPRHLTENTQAPHLALTRLEVLGAPLPTATPYWLLQVIDLDYHASIVSLDFSVLDFTSPKRNRLAYRIPGLSNQWIDLDSQHRITLTNLDAGLHQLEVRAANADSVWSEPLQIAIRRAPSPWHTPWAYAVYALVLLLLAAHQIHRGRQKLRSVQQAKRRLEAEVALRTRELRDSNRQLAEASQAKTNFLARMSHELRTPMNGVLGSTELLARTAQSAGQSRLTDTIRSSAQVLLQIVNDLLDLSKIQADKIELEILPVDLVQVLEECATLFSANAAGKGVEVIVDPPPPLDRVLEGDGLRIRQIIMNLVGNAVKFTARGMIMVRGDVSFEQRQPRLQIEVTDTGIGMDAATIERIFEPFTQADESTTRRFGGTGLGLAICRELAQRMSGTISVISRPAVGSSFRVEIPLRLGASIEPAVPLAAEVRILCQRPALAQALQRHARALGCRVHEGGIPQAGELLLVDAGSCAEAVQARVRDSGPRSLIVIASDTEAEELLEAADPTALLLVQKPVHRARLREALATLAGHRVAALSHTAPPEVRFAGRILLVEDEAVNAAIAQGYLALLDVHSVWASSGAEALRQCAESRFDLIMMDLNMPEMDGFAVARALRESAGGNQQTPIVALTAHRTEVYRDSCLAAGMKDMLSKPYTLAECTQLLAGYLPEQPMRDGLERKIPSALVFEELDASDDELPPVNATSLAGALLSDIDRATVASLRSLGSGSGSPDLYATLAGLFLRSSAVSVDQLSLAVAAGERARIAETCHKLGAAAANVGALAFARQARELEYESATAEAARLHELSQPLIVAHPTLCAELQKYTLRASA